MIPSHQFYSAYLNNHFLIKKQQALNVLSMDESQLLEHISNIGLKVNSIEYLKTIKIDLLQSFYQGTETLFGLMHSLENQKSNALIPDYLVKARIGDLHKYIQSFNSFEHCYNYLVSNVRDIANRNIPLYQWLFYPLSLIATDFSDLYLQRLNSIDNIKGIALTLNRIANLFNSEAHNSIKHGLRCILIDKFNINIEIPEIEGLNLPEEFTKFSGEKDVLLYYAPEKGSDVAIQVLVPLNIFEIIYHIDGLHNLQYNLVNDRDIIFSTIKPEKVTSHLFSHKNIANISFKSTSDFKSIRVGPAQ